MFYTHHHHVKNIQVGMPLIRQGCNIINRKIALLQTIDQRHKNIILKHAVASELSMRGDANVPLPPPKETLDIVEHA